MKRTLSMFLAVVMVLSMVVMGIPAMAVANTGTNTLSENNVGIKVPYFSGSSYFNEVTGRFGSFSHSYDAGDEAPIGDKKVATSDSRLVLDGVISDGEWGIPLLDISSEYAAQKGKSTTPSAANTYYYWNGNDGDNYLNLSAGLRYKVWMAWDEDYLYVAAEVIDPDNVKLAAGGENVWDGDCFQMRIDPEGPNSIVGGGSYDPSVNKYPFKSSVRATGVETYGGLIPNIGIGYVDGAGLEMQDMSLRYFPYEKEVTLADGTVDYIATTWKQCNAYCADEFLDGPNPFGVTFGSYWSELTGNASNKKECKTVYEFAVPWHYMDGSYLDYDKATETYTVNLVDYVPTAGDEYGVVIALLNAARGGSGYNSWLTWGSGVCGGQVDGNDYMTAGGSNSMLLVADELGTTGCEHTFAEPDCTHPYVCTKCGYEKGYTVGHSYTHVVNAYPTETTDGEIVSTCATCGDVHTQILPAKAKEVYHQFTSEDDVKGASGEWNAEGYSYLYVEQDADGKDTTIPIIDPLTNQQKDTLEYYNDKLVIDLTNDRPGTYFSNATDYQTYSYKYDFRLTGEAFPASAVQTGYENGFFHWFGGSKAQTDGILYGMNYVAGFFPSELDSTVGTFKIMESPGAASINKDTGEPDGIIIAQSPVVDLGTDWHTFVFTFDDETDTAIMYCDGEVVCGAWDPGFDMNGQSQRALVRRFNVSCMLTDMAFGNTTAFTNAVAPAGYTVTCDGEVIGTYEEGATVELPVPAFADGERFYTWEGEGVTVTRGSFSSRGTTANKRTYTMVMPAQDVVLTSTYVKIGDYDGNARVNNRDFLLLKKLVSGEIELDDEKTEAADTNLDGKVSARDILVWSNVNSGNSAFEK